MYPFYYSFRVSCPAVSISNCCWMTMSLMRFEVVEIERTLDLNDHNASRDAD